jgi:hypothetical protein
LTVDYERTGRKLGTGLKVLGRMAKQRLDAPPAPASSGTAPAAQNNPRPASPPPKPNPTAVPNLKAAREGGRRFGKAVWGPFSRAGHVLWLEITGVFFALFAVYFVSEAWKLRHATGIDHTHFLEFVIFAVVFSYFCVTSFVRARRREKR